jgi:hypothetical protein
MLSSQPGRITTQIIASQHIDFALTRIFFASPLRPNTNHHIPRQQEKQNRRNRNRNLPTAQLNHF